MDVGDGRGILLLSLLIDPGSLTELVDNMVWANTPDAVRVYRRRERVCTLHQDQPNPRRFSLSLANTRLVRRVQVRSGHFRFVSLAIATGPLYPLMGLVIADLKRIRSLASACVAIPIFYQFNRHRRPSFSTGERCRLADE